MAPELPAINLSSIQEQDLMTTYFMLFQYMSEELVHKDDLRIILESNTVTGTCQTPSGAGTIVGKAVFVPSDSVARGKAKVYQSMVESGRVAREGLISGMNAITNSKTSF